MPDCGSCEEKTHCDHCDHQREKRKEQDVKQDHGYWKLRRRIAEWSAAGKCGHYGSAVSCLNIVRAAWTLYKAKEVSEVILSKGHAGAALRAVVFDDGAFVPEQQPMHLERKEGQHVHWPSGSLGNALAAAVGLAITARYDARPPVCVICGDAEMQEGVACEAVSFAEQHELPMLIVVDRNGMGAFGEVPRYPPDQVCIEDHMSTIITHMRERLAELDRGVERTLYVDTFKSLESHYKPATTEEIEWLRQKELSSSPSC